MFVWGATCTGGTHVQTLIKPAPSQENMWNINALCFLRQVSVFIH